VYCSSPGTLYLAIKSETVANDEYRYPLKSNLAELVFKEQPNNQFTLQESSSTLQEEEHFIAEKEEELPQDAYGEEVAEVEAEAPKRAIITDILQLSATHMGVYTSTSPMAYKDLLFVYSMVERRDCSLGEEGMCPRIIPCGTVTVKKDSCFVD